MAKGMGGHVTALVQNYNDVPLIKIPLTVSEVGKFTACGILLSLWIILYQVVYKSTGLQCIWNVNAQLEAKLTMYTSNSA